MLHLPLVCNVLAFTVWYTIKRTLFEHRQSRTCTMHMMLWQCVPELCVPERKSWIYVPWKRHPLDNASLGRCVPRLARPLDYASLGRPVPVRYVPTLDRIEILVKASQFGLYNILEYICNKGECTFVKQKWYCRRVLAIALAYIYSSVCTYMN